MSAQPETTHTPSLAATSLPLLSPIASVDSSTLALSSSVPPSRLATPALTLAPPLTPAAAAPVLAILLSSPLPLLALAESTALKLAKQLRNFQGCTHEQHHEADQRHQEHHQRPNIHSE